MKKLVYVDPQSYRNLSMYDYSLLKGMSEYEIIYCCNKQYDGPKLENVQFCPVFTYHQDMNPLMKIISYFCSLLKLVGILKTIRPNVLHIQWWKQWDLDYFFLSVYKKYVDQIVFTAHNLVPHDSGNSLKAKCMKYYGKVDKIIVHDKNSRNELINDFKIEEDKIAVIAHGILEFSVDETDVKSIMNKISTQYSLKNKLVFSTMGGQSPYKGTDLVSDAFLSSDFLKNNDDVFLIIAGKGDIATPERFNECKNVLVANYSLTNSEFQAIMRLTDVLLLPYRKISQSGVLLTAIQNKVPFAVTPVGGLAEPLEIASVGWIISTPSVEAVREFMENISNEKLYIRELKIKQQNWMLLNEKYNWTNISIQTEQFYNKPCN